MDEATKIAFRVAKAERYPFIERVLTRFGYAQHEKLKSVPDAQPYLNVGITVEHLDSLASRLSDNEAALALHHARRTLFQTISPARRTRA